MWCCTCAVTLTLIPGKTPETEPHSWFHLHDSAPSQQFLLFIQLLRPSSTSPAPTHLYSGDYCQPARLNWEWEEQVQTRWWVLDLRAVTAWKMRRAHRKTLNPLTHSYKHNNIKMSYISFELVSSMGATCAANKVTAICAILFQRGSCYREKKKRSFSSPERTQGVCLESSFCEQKKTILSHLLILLVARSWWIIEAEHNVFRVISTGEHRWNVTKAFFSRVITKL